MAKATTKKKVATKAKNPTIGKQIRSLKDLLNAADNRQSVTGIGITTPTGHQAAAWVANQSARTVHILIETGLFVYRPKN